MIAGTGIRIYESQVNNNTALPTVTANWRLVDFEGLDDRYASRAQLTASFAIGHLSEQTTDMPSAWILCTGRINQ